MATRIISIDLVGNDKASKVIAGIGTTSEQAAAKSAAAFGASTSKIGAGLSGLGSTAAAMGVPFASSLNVIGAHFDKAGASGKGFGSTISKVGAVEAVAAGAGVAVLATQVGNFVEQGRESAKVGRQTEAVLKSTGGVANVSASQVGALANSLSKKAGVDDELIQSGENVLLTFTKVRDEVGAGNDIFDQAATSALDMSAALGTDLQGNVIRLGRALQDPVKGVTALTRAGVVFTQAQKDQIKTLVESGNTLAAQKIILKELTTEFGGAAAAAADPFSKAQVNIENLQEAIGGKLIPVILGAGNAAATVGHDFQAVNAATEGLAGKTLALGAAVPVAFFAYDKLRGVAGAVGSAFQRLGGVLHLTQAANTATAASENELAVAQSNAAVAASRKELAIAKLPSLQAAEAAATTQAVAANEAQVLALAEASAASEANVAAQAQLTAAREAATAAGLSGAAATEATAGADAAATIAAERLAAAETEVAVSSRAAAVAQGQYGAAARAAAASSAAASEASAAGGAAAGAGVVAAGPILAGAAAVVALGYGLSKLTDNAELTSKKVETLNDDLLKGGEVAKKARAAYSDVIGADVGSDLQRYADLLVANGSAQDLNAAKARAMGDAIAGNGGNIKKAGIEIDQVTGSLKKLAEEYGAGAVQSAQLTAAQKQLRDDLVSGAASATGNAAAQKLLAADKRLVFNVSKAQATTENQVTAATNKGATAAKGAAGAVRDSASAADTGAFSYLGLAKSVNTAADALAAINSQASGPLTAEISVDKSKASFQDALTALNAPPETSGGGSSGATQTATAAALDHTSKLLAERDAERQVAQAASGIVSAQTQLAQAQQSSRQAQDAVTAAAQNYRTVLHGVAADSQAARDAQEALTRAQDSAASSAINAREASRTLQQAKNDKPLAQIAVRQAATTLRTDKESGADRDTIIRDEIALKDARLAASAVQDHIKELENGVTEARLDAKDKTHDLTTAQKDLNTTLHGYPANSKEARQAQQDLTTAQLAAKSAAEGVTGAQQGLVSAQDNVATSALGLKRAQADLRGELDSLSSGGGAIGKAKSAMDSYKIKFDEVKAAAVDMASSVAAHSIATGHSVAQALATEINTIKDIISIEPQLAATFGPILDTLYGKLSAEAQAGHIPNPTSGLNVRRHEAGGPIVGNDPTGIPILAHPGEYVIRQKAVDKYGLHMMEEINAGKADLPKFATGGQVGVKFTPVAGASAGPGTSVKVPQPPALNANITATPDDLGKAAKELIGGFDDGLRKQWAAKVVPFFEGTHAKIAARFADAHQWLAPPTSELMSGMLEAALNGFVPIDDLFQTKIPNELRVGGLKSAGAAAQGWKNIEGAFAVPVNWTITNVLNPLVGDVNKIAHAVGMDDIAGKVSGVPVGSFATGGVIPKTGLALVHEGEGVLPKAAMTKLPPQVFEQLKAGETIAQIFKTVAGEKAETGAAKVSNGVGNRAALNVVQYLQQLTAANPPPAIASSHGAAIPIGDLPTGGDPRVPGHSIVEWATDLLKTMREPATPVNDSTMVTWANHESGGYRGPQHDSGGLNNPLNTTEPWPGSTMGGAQGNIRNYRTFDDGVDAQAHNLSSPNFGYPAILAGLAAQNQRQTFDAIDNSAFGTKNLATGGPTGQGPSSGIPIMAHPGEWVIKKSSVDKYGPHMMERLNAGKVDLPKFAVGGAVDTSSTSDDHRTYMASLPKFAAGGPVSAAPRITVPRSHANRSAAPPLNIVVNLHGPVMGTDVGQVVVQSIQKELDRNGFIVGTSISKA